MKSALTYSCSVRRPSPFVGHLEGLLASLLELLDEEIPLPDLGSAMTPAAAAASITPRPRQSFYFPTRAGRGISSSRSSRRLARRPSRWPTEKGDGRLTLQEYVNALFIDFDQG